MADLPKVTVKPPEPFTLTNTSADANAWRLWRSIWESYATIALQENENRPPKFAKAVLMSTIGMRTVTLYSECEPADTDTVAQILTRLKDAFWECKAKLLTDTDLIHGSNNRMNR